MQAPQSELVLIHGVRGVLWAVPGPVPGQSVKATPYEDSIHLYWKEPAEPNGIIIQYEVGPPKTQFGST